MPDSPPFSIPLLTTTAESRSRTSHLILAPGTRRRLADRRIGGRGCGYLYAWDRDLPESARILDAVMIYDVGRLPEQVHECEVDVEIIWSSDGRELR